MPDMMEILVIAEATPPSTSYFAVTLDLIRTVVGLAGFFLVIVQLRKHLEANRKVHQWNRRKAGQDACKEFLDPKVVDCWTAIQVSVVEQKKKFEELTPSEQVAIRKLLSFFESIGIFIRHNIVDQQVAYDHFRGVCPIVAECAQGFIKDYRTIRGDDHVFEYFEDMLRQFKHIDDRLRANHVERGRLPPLEPLGDPGETETAASVSRRHR